jgi:hypothetical protein
VNIIVAAAQVKHPFHANKCDPFKSIPPLLFLLCNWQELPLLSNYRPTFDTSSWLDLTQDNDIFPFFRNASVGLNTSKMGKKMLSLVVASVLVTLASAAPLATEKRGTLPVCPAKLHGMMLNVT